MQLKDIDNTAIGLGNNEYSAVTKEIKKSSGSENEQIAYRKSGSGNELNAYRKYIFQELYEICKFAAEHGISAAINHFKSNNLKESTFCKFKSKYHVEIKDEPIKNLYPKSFLSIKKQGRPILSKELDAKIQKNSDGSYNCGTVFNTNIAIATANGFLKQGR